MLNSLPRLTRDAVKLINLVAGCSAMSDSAKTWLPGIEEVLSKLTQVACKIEFKRASFEPKPEITGALFAITWPPKAGMAWIESDIKTLQNCAYRVIGTKSIPEDLDPKLSDLESGIVRYILTHVFESTKEAFQISQSLELPKSPVLCLSLEFKLGDLNSYIRLWLTPEMLSATPVSSAKELGKQRCMSAEFPLRVELGQVPLTPEELKNLEAGDIVILENASLNSVQAFLGDPACVTLKGSVKADEATMDYSFSIEELS